MIIGPDYVFISVPKAGTHTMYWILKNHFGGKQQKGAYHQKNVPKAHRKKFLFTMVRNPYARAVSAWTSLTKTDPRYKKAWVKQAGGPDFESFMRLIAINRPKTRLPGIIAPIPMHEWIGGIKFDKIIKIENLANDIHTLPFIKDAEFKIPQLLKRTDKDEYEKYLDDKTIPLIHKWAKTDFKDFGYKKR